MIVLNSISYEEEEKDYKEYLLNVSEQFKLKQYRLSIYHYNNGKVTFNYDGEDGKGKPLNRSFTFTSTMEGLKPNKPMWHNVNKLDKDIANFIKDFLDVLIK